jgi:hypothetical protein
VSQPLELRESATRYYTAYYRDTLGIPDWSAFVRRRGEEEIQERARLVAYFETLRRLTRGAIVRGFAAAGVTELTFYDDDRPRETLGRARVRTGAYYRLSGVAPYLELAARKT